MQQETIQQTLDRILADLKSGDSARTLAAIHELETIKYSSEAIVLQLEKLALHGDGAVQKLALAALSLETSQFAASKLNALNKNTRQIILNEITAWEEDGLIEQDHAEVLRRHYDFDIQRGIPIKTVAQPETLMEEKVEAVETAPPAITAEPARPSAPAVPAISPAPRASLMQSLLSEFSIRIYLYLGAFFVIVAAAILAALVEAARLPILLIATLAFTAGALTFKKRLPQPSFAFAIVFSFLLPIDAAVIADTMNLSLQSQHWFWAGMFLVMTAFWAGGAWMYLSRLFALASFSAFMLGVYRFDLALNAPFQWVIFSLGIASLAGLIAAQILIKWKGQKFALPNFLLTQGLQAFTLTGTLLGIGLTSFDVDTPDRWIALTLTWLTGAAFYAASGLVIPFLLFPWAAVASLFLVPWLFLNALDASPTTMIAGFGMWAALAGLASELALRMKPAGGKQYHHPFLSLSLPLFMVSILWGFVESNTHGFFPLLGSAVLYVLLHALRPRWYVWTTALIAGLAAYFSFFALPLMTETFVYFGFQVLIASLLLLIPELFFKGSFTFSKPWNWPPVVLGTTLTGFNLLFMLAESASYPATGEKSIVFGVYALLFAAYAWRFAQPLIGYLATAYAAVSVALGLSAIEVDYWLPALTILSVIYFFTGYAASRSERGRSWGAMLIHSGLGLGVILALISVLTLKLTGGWYVLAIAALFAVEMFTRRNGYLELFIQSLVSIGLINILNDFNVRQLAFYLFSASLVWLACDAAWRLTFKDRVVQPVTWLGCTALTLTAVVAILLNNVTAGPAAICFTAYTAFFAAYAWIYRQPLLGYLSTSGAAATCYFALAYFEIETWLPIFTALALLYYIAGFLLRKRTAGWSRMFSYSGLGLGSAIALVALVSIEPTGGWYALIAGALFVVETGSSRDGRFEAGVHILFSIAAFLILRDFNIDQMSYTLLAISLVWLTGDVAFRKTFTSRKLAAPVQAIGLGITLINGFSLASGISREAAIGYGIYAAFLAVYALAMTNPALGYLSTISLSLSVFFAMLDANARWWIFPIIAIASLYYVAGYILRAGGKAEGWDRMLVFSGLGLGAVTALLAPVQSGGIEKAIPIAISATLFAAEAFARRNVWLGFPANALYLIAYFTLLFELDVDEPQFFSIGAALLGMLMHFLLVRAKSRTGAFLMGMLSQLTLLGTTYIQMVSTEQLGFFFAIFAQSLAVLVYGILMRSRSLVIAPIAFAVLGTVTVLYSALRDLSIVVIVGVTGIILLVLGVLAVLMRERITTLAERFSDWNA